METIQLTRRAAVLLAITGAILVTSAAGPASAACGYKMTQHPLRGHFPKAAADQTLNGHTAFTATTSRAGNLSLKQKAASRGDWLRGDFPRAAERQADSGSDYARSIRN